MFEVEKFSIDEEFKYCNLKSNKLDDDDTEYCTRLRVGKNIDKLYREEGIDGIKEVYEYIELFNIPNLEEIETPEVLNIYIQTKTSHLYYDKGFGYVIKNKVNNEYKLLNIIENKNYIKKDIYIVGNVYIIENKAYIFIYTNPLLIKLNNFIYGQKKIRFFDYKIGFLKQNLMNKELNKYIYISDNAESLVKIDKSKCKGIFHILKNYNLNNYCNKQNRLIDDLLIKCTNKKKLSTNTKLENDYCSIIVNKSVDLNVEIQKDGLNKVKQKYPYLELTKEINLKRAKIESDNLASKNNPYYIEIFKDNNPITNLGYVLYDVSFNNYYIIKKHNNNIYLIGSIFFNNPIELKNAIIFYYYNPVLKLFYNKNISKDESKIYISSTSDELVPFSNFIGYFKFNKLDSKRNQKIRMEYKSIPKASKTYVSESVSDLINFDKKKCKGFYVNNSEIKIYSSNVVKGNASTEIEKSSSPFKQGDIPQKRAEMLNSPIRKQNKPTSSALQNVDNSSYNSDNTASLSSENSDNTASIDNISSTNSNNTASKSSTKKSNNVTTQVIQQAKIEEKIKNTEKEYRLLKEKKPNEINQLFKLKQKIVNLAKQKLVNLANQKLQEKRAFNAKKTYNVSIASIARQKRNAKSIVSKELNKNIQTVIEKKPNTVKLTPWYPEEEIKEQLKEKRRSEKKEQLKQKEKNNENAKIKKELEEETKQTIKKNNNAKNNQIKYKLEFEKQQKYQEKRNKDRLDTINKNKCIIIAEDSVLNKKLNDENIFSTESILSVDVRKSNNLVDKSNILTMHIKNNKDNKKYKLQYHISEDSNIFNDN